MSRIRQEWSNNTFLSLTGRATATLGEIAYTHTTKNYEKPKVNFRAVLNFT